MIELDLPLPPTTNNLYLNVRRGRVKSPRYRAWIDEATVEVSFAAWDKIEGPWMAELVLPQNVRGDIDNYAKPVLDLVVKYGAVDDDRHLQELMIRKNGRAPGRCRLILRGIE